MRDFYILLTIFTAAVIWVSCTAVGKATTGMTTASAATMPSYQEDLSQYNTKTIPEENQLSFEPISVPVRVARGGALSGYVNDLIKVKEILDTVAALSEDTYKLMSPPLQKSVH